MTDRQTDGIVVSILREEGHKPHKGDRDRKGAPLSSLPPPTVSEITELSQQVLEDDVV